MLSGSDFLYFDEVVMLHELRQRPVIDFWKIIGVLISWQ